MTALNARKTREKTQAQSQIKRTQQETNRRLRLWNVPQDRLEAEKEKDVTSSPNMPRNTVARKPTGTRQSTTERSKQARQVEIIKKHREHECYSEIEYYDPYPYQKRFHGTGSNCNQRLLITGNRIGKSFSGATETVVTHAPTNIWDVVSQLGL